MLEILISLICHKLFLQLLMTIESHFDADIDVSDYAKG